MAHAPRPAPIAVGRRRRDDPPVLGPTTFLARQAYRRQRLMDAARILPILGAILVFLPMIWVSEEAPWSMGHAIVYFFGLWAGLVAISAILARLLSEPIRGRRGRVLAGDTDADADAQAAPVWAPMPPDDQADGLLGQREDRGR